MPKFAANLTMLFNEMPFLDRFAAAKAAGFAGVEYLFPYDFEKAQLREQLEAHRAHATCASCHVRMDPLGFGLENFDAVGAWRTVDGKFPVDASGTLPDGRTFNGPRELKTIMKAERDVFAEGLTDKLLTYGLGRGLERYDRRTVRQIAKNVAAQDYRFSSLVLEIARSLPFQMRRGERVP